MRLSPVLFGIVLALPATARPSAGGPCATQAPGAVSPNRHSVFFNGLVSVPHQSPSGDALLFRASIGRGHRGRVVTVTATASVDETSYVIIGTPIVNTTFLFGAPALNLRCDATSFPVGVTPGCTVTATWWLDLDAAERGHPGEFIDKPLCLSFTGSERDQSVAGPTKTNLTVTALTARK